MARLNLPSPRRTVRAGLRMCRRMDYTDAEALVLITRIADAARDQVLIMGEYDTGWIAAVREEAQCQLLRLRQKQ